MALRELSRREILQAVAEYDRLGQDRFLDKYGFGAARSYRLVVDGKTYDSKAIVGAAHGFLSLGESLERHGENHGCTIPSRRFTTLACEISAGATRTVGCCRNLRGVEAVGRRAAFQYSQ